MRRVGTVAVCITLLVVSFQASYSHLHFNETSDHVKEHHLAQGLTLHTHLDAPANAGHHSAMQPFHNQEKSDALFLQWTPVASPINALLTALPVESGISNLSIQVAYHRASPVCRSHDPPL